MIYTIYKWKSTEIYDRYFNQWLEITANLLREKNFSELNLANLIIEIEVHFLKIIPLV